MVSTMGIFLPPVDRSNPLEIFGLEKVFSQKALKIRYRELMRWYHGDAGGSELSCQWDHCVAPFRQLHYFDLGYWLLGLATAEPDFRIRGESTSRPNYPANLTICFVSCPRSGPADALGYSAVE